MYIFPQKRWALIILAFLLWSIFSIHGTASTPEDHTAAAIPADIQADLDQHFFVPVIVTLGEQPNGPYTPLSTGKERSSGRSHRTQMLVKKLQATARASREKIEPIINEESRKGNIRNYTPFWIVNAFKAEVNAAALQRLSNHPQVQHIRSDRRHYVLPSNLLTSSSEQGLNTPYNTSKQKPGTESGIWNLELIKAPAVWKTGITGEDVVVAIMDTGVNPNHPALQGHYRGDLPGHSHKTSWYDATADSGREDDSPRDLNGHGTHIAGLILGGKPEEPLGVAPGANWIGVNIFSKGLAWDSHIIQAFQWLMAPGGDPQNAPHIINCSWASRPEFAEDHLQWEILYNLEQAGILVVFAAGNNKTAGPGSPASYPHALAVGAVQKNGDKIEIADFSSRGPVEWQGINYLKPELTAPGVNIRSAWLKEDYFTLDGTSLAAAHVSGAAALLLESNPQLLPFEIVSILKKTTAWDPAWNKNGERPNNAYGFGLLDAYEAVRANTVPSREIIFSDGAEEGVMNWSTSPDNPWKITREKVYDGKLAFADSPWENYKNKAASWLGLAKPLSLERYQSPVLSFWHFYGLQKGKNREDDYAYIEISPDGQNWLSLYRFSGTNRQYQPFSLPLNLPPDVKSFYLRFRLQSNNNGPGKGWYLDNITVTAQPLTPGTDDPAPETEDKPPLKGTNQLGGDLNNDGCIDLTDLALWAFAWHSRPGDKNWNPLADLNNDGFVDAYDLDLLMQKLGAHNNSS
ncbi:MAG: S8 family serine peptidase [Firmicutes bacterium]|nr:S8 family serine peptidase [Bacillota bacterium]